jgi:hypothetical protein
LEVTQRRALEPIEVVSDILTTARNLRVFRIGYWRRFGRIRCSDVGSFRLPPIHPNARLAVIEDLRLLYAYTLAKWSTRIDLSPTWRLSLFCASLIKLYNDNELVVRQLVNLDTLVVQEIGKGRNVDDNEIVSLL